METTNIIPIGCRNGLLPQDVVLLNADSNYTTVFFSNGKKMVFSQTLKNMERYLQDCSNFFRPHKSFVVNLNYIKEYNHHEPEAYIEMKNGFKVSVSRRRKTAFKRRLVAINS